ncbi:MAG: hypothetical protein PHH59_09565 [Methylovulum sp.]|uniref:hypothetical protein n=1 Tax=Methylovulum sp. TaxID=1916980 RepID=UPI002613A9B7|nr:hypothetical protein [Methylovulum sp.]MDD2724252.1 hypothetical protein [Methylovulum sp.]MDD5123015.1 hypothetical protein [Methylovulum sp.]
MKKHFHKLAGYTALILISASPLPFDDAYAETSEKKTISAESLIDKATATNKRKIKADQPLE